MFPNLKSNNPPMTRGQRRVWLALEEQRRRRARAARGASAARAIVLSSDGHGHLTWTANFTTPSDGVSIYISDDGVTWGSHPYDGWTFSASSRDCSGARGYFRICASDENGIDILPYSNVVYSDGL
jgi:hypothetical protein